MWPSITHDHWSYSWSAHPKLSKAGDHGLFTIAPTIHTAEAILCKIPLRPPFSPNRSVGRAIPDYFGANQWCRTRVSGNDNHSLFITSKKSQFAIQLFHYRLPLCLAQLRAVSRMNIIAKSNKFRFPMILV